MNNCKFAESKNLLKAYAIFKAYENDPQKLEEEMAKAFVNYAEAIETIKGMTSGEVITTSPDVSSPVEQVDLTGRKFTLNSDVENINSYFTLSGVNSLIMEIEFRKAMLGSSILNLDTFEYYDPTTTDGLHDMQSRIFGYKKKLLKDITGDSYSFLTENISNEEYTDIVNQAIASYESKLALNANLSNQDPDTFQSYVILKTFDRLVEKYAPYVKVDKSYTGKQAEGFNKYLFNPTVKHRTNFAKTEKSDITKQMGNLAETILKVIPDINNEGKALNSSVGVSGFNGSMLTLKRAILYSNIFGKDTAKFRKSVLEGAGSLLDPNNDYNLYNAIDRFIAINTKEGSQGSYSEFRQTFLHNKLRGIQKVLFSEETPNSIKSIFAQLFVKSENTNYRAYTYDREISSFKGKELKSRMYSTQKFAFQHVIEGGLKTLIKSSVASSDLLQKYKITPFFKNGVKYLYISQKVNGEEIGKKLKLTWTDIKTAKAEGDLDIINDFMTDAYSYYIPDTYNTCMTNDTDYKWENDFAPFIALASQTALYKTGSKIYIEGAVVNTSGVNIDTFNKNLNSIGARLSVIFGDSARSTLKSLGGNSLPLFGQTSLEYNWMSCLDEAKEDESQYNSQRYGLFWDNAELISGIYKRSEIELNGKIKDCTALNLNELNRVGILDDFWFPSRSGSDENIYLQNATFSDKSTHFLVGYKLEKVFEGTQIKSYIKDLFGENKTLKQIIEDSVINGSKKYFELIRLIRRDKYSATARKILTDYATVFPELGINIDAISSTSGEEQSILSCVNELNKVDEFLRTKSLSKEISLESIRKAFRDKGIKFEEEIHAISPKNKDLGGVRLNETLLNYVTVSSSKENWNKWINKNLDKFGKNINSLVLSGFDPGSGMQIRELLKDDLLNQRFNKDHSNFYNEATREYRLVGKDGTIHPIAEVYFASDILLSQEYNSLTIGEIWSHPNKVGDKVALKADGTIYSQEELNAIVANNENLKKLNQDQLDATLGISKETYLEYSEANRLVNQVKRSVIFGSTIHPFAQKILNDSNKESGVPSKINISIIEDMGGDVFTINGVIDSIDSQDGSGLCTALQSKLENNSLMDAAVGNNKKTIVHSIDPQTGMPVLLKWAVYSLTNTMRRNGAGSAANVEELVRRMYSIEFDGSNIDLNKIYQKVASQNGNIFIKDPISLTYYEVVGYTKNVNNTWSQVDKDGNLHGEFTTNTLYDIDQAFGGAWTYDENGIGTEASVDLLTETAIEYNLRDKQISYAVNKSACKVGQTNLNSEDTWTNPNAKLDYFQISTQFAGVMMNADHELDEAEVTEMSQMISALIEDGHYTKEVLSIYDEIGQIALNNSRIQQYIKAASSEDKAKMAELVGKSLVKSFETGSKDTIGLAQAFIRKAVKETNRTGVKTYNLPFNDSTIWGAVIADVTSTLSKLGIRRKYEGFAGVLNPSHNMTEYYRTADGVKLFEQFEQECKDTLLAAGATVENNMICISNGENKTYYRSWSEAARRAPLINNKQNPFWENHPITDIDFEDTVMIMNDGVYKETYVNNFKTYDELKHLSENGIVIINTATPKNLRGADTKFTINRILDNSAIPTQFSMYDTDSVRASHYITQLTNKKYKQEKDPYFAQKIELINKVLGTAFTSAKDIKKSDSDICNAKTQEFLRKLDLGISFTRRLNSGERFDPTNPTDIDCLISSQDFFRGDPNAQYYVTSYYTRPAEIIAGRYQMEKLGLDGTDHIFNIKDYNYFLDKLKTKYKEVSFNSEENPTNIYSRVLYKNGVPYLIKVGEVDPELRLNLNIKPCAEKNIIGDDLRFESEIIISDSESSNLDERFRVEKINDGINDYVYITVQNEEDLEKLTDSDYFDDVFYDVTGFESTDTLKFKDQLEQAAKDKFTSFKNAIKLVGARIPTQAMQSFMPFEIIAFTNTEQNVVYVPKANTHIEGSDYDIDKIYLLAATILENGRIQSGSALQKVIGFDNAVKLFRPNGVEYIAGTNDNFAISSKYLVTLFKNKDYSNLVFLMNRVSGNNQIAFTPATNEAEQKAIDLFLRMINKHSHTPSFIRDSQEALKTRVFTKIFDITRAAQNQMKAQITVDTCTGEFKSYAKQTTSGKAEKLVTPYVPSSKYVMQEQNMLGKAVVGIGAVSLKTYFILSTSYNRKCDEIIECLNTRDFSKARVLLESIVIKRPTVDGSIINTTLANINLGEIKTIAENLIWNGKEDFMSRLNELIINTSKISTPEYLSGIISLAADNAKDLALPKLNATADLVDIYTTSFMIGVSFKEIADIMTSDMFGWMTRAGANNIFDESTSKNKVKDMVKFALLEFTPNQKKMLATVVYSYLNYLNNTKKSLTRPVYTNKKLDLIATFNNPRFVDDLIKAFEDEKSGIIANAPERYTAEELENAQATAENAETTYEKPWEKLDFYNAYRTIKLLRERFNFTKEIEDGLFTGKENTSNIKKLNFLNKILTYVEEMSCLGQQASINQGLKTDIRSFYTFGRKISDLINDRLEQKTKSEEITKEYVIGKFDFNKFLLDEQYANTWIEYINNFKLLECFNIVEALKNSPNFFAMSKIYPYAEKILKSTVSIYDAGSKIADELIQTKKLYGNLSDNDFKAITGYITDLNIYRFLEQSDIAIDLTKVKELTGYNPEFYESVGTLKRSSKDSLKLNTARNIATFKHLMETSIIYGMRIDPRFKDNKFLRSLTPKNNIKLESQTIGLNIPIMDVDSDEGLATQYANILLDFNNIANEDFCGLKVGEWFFLYNLICNKNSFGQQSLTRIFEDLIDSTNSPKIINDYYAFIGNSVNNVSENYNLQEVEEYISKYSKDTKIPTPSIEGGRPVLPEDFTLYLPITCDLNNTKLGVKKVDELYTWKTLGSIGTIEAIEEFAASLNRKFSGAVKIIDNDIAKDMNLPTKEPAFIKNGVIYLNTSVLSKFSSAKALGVMSHELAHLVLASIKNSKNNALYYSLLRRIKEEKDYEDIASDYSDRIGSDLDEEVFCTKLAKILSGYIDQNSEVEMGIVNGGLILEGFNNLFTEGKKITIDDVVDSNLQYIIDNFAQNLFTLGSINIEAIKGSQKLAEVKTELYKSTDENNKLKQDCD